MQAELNAHPTACEWDEDFRARIWPRPSEWAAGVLETVPVQPSLVIGLLDYGVAYKWTGRWQGEAFAPSITYQPSAMAFFVLRKVWVSHRHK